MKLMRFFQLFMIVFLLLCIVSCDQSSKNPPETTAGITTDEGESSASGEETSCAHSYTDVAGQAPTCAADGFSAYKLCTLCGEKSGYTALPATRDHRLTEHPKEEQNPLFFTCACGFSVVSDLRSRPLIDQLTDAQYENFVRLYDMLKNRERSCTFTSAVTQAEADTFYYLLQGQCPELFLLEYENASFFLTLTGAGWNPDCMSEARYAEVAAVMIDTMIEWDADCDGLSETEKVKYLIRWMNTNTVYSSIGTRVRSLYGGIIDREIACVGYAQLLMWGLGHFEIPCISVNGYVPSKNEGHMWNLVRLDGEWYQVDPGWGTVTFNGTVYPHYAYTNVTDAELGIGVGRVYSDCYAACGIEIPACTATAQNAARLEGAYLSSTADVKAVFASSLKAALDRGEDLFTIVCKDEALMQSLHAYVQSAGSVAMQYGVPLYWFSPGHDDTTRLYFVNILLARPNMDAVTLEAPDLREGVGYKLALRQNKNGQTVFFSGSVTGKYLSATADPSRATDVFYKKVDGGFRIWFIDGYMKKYVDVFVNENGEVQAGVSLVPTAVYSIDSASGAIVTTVNGERYWLGTYNSYSTIGASKIGYITGANAANLRVSQFPAELVMIAGEDAVRMDEPPIPKGEGTAYKLVMEQGILGETLYFQGWRTRNFPASTTEREKSPNVYLEEVAGGYQLYYLWGENKMYLNVQGFGANGVSLQLQPTPGAPFQYHEALGIYTVEMYGEEYFIGCYGEYDNFSLSSIHYITGANAESVGVSQFPAYLEEAD